MARYIYNSPQQEYEKFCHVMAEEDEKVLLKQLERKIRDKMADRRDFQAYYYRPGIAKYHRVAKKAADEMESVEGDN
jgi:NADH dehydrogenase (ubiquinone) 1 beta subcomplex subunit 5